MSVAGDGDDMEGDAPGGSFRYSRSEMHKDSELVRLKKLYFEEIWHFTHLIVPLTSGFRYSRSDMHK